MAGLHGLHGLHSLHWIARRVWTESVITSPFPACLLTRSSPSPSTIAVMETQVTSYAVFLIYRNRDSSGLFDTHQYLLDSFLVLFHGWTSSHVFPVASLAFSPLRLPTVQGTLIQILPPGTLSSSLESLTLM